jgi:hypothetical protein
MEIQVYEGETIRLKHLLEQTVRQKVQEKMYLDPTINA